MLSGCRSVSSEYGSSKGYGGRTSLNGFGALRSAFEQAGFRSRNANRLSSRVRRTDTIVWTPTWLGSVDSDVTRWFDQWMRQGNRTLVYILPDSGSEADYWTDAARLASPEQRVEYRTRAARCVNERIQWRLNRFDVESNGWFQVQSLPNRRLATELQGPWLSTVATTNDGATEGDDLRAALEYLLVPYDEDVAKKLSAGNLRSAPDRVETGPGTIPLLTSMVVQPTQTPIEFRPLLSTSEEAQIVAEVTSGHWSNSKVLVVAGGSLLTNYAFSRKANRRLAERIIREATPSGKSKPVVAFLISDWGNLPVSDREPDTPLKSGMEMLTEWPISLVTMHGLVFLMIVCLACLPIFGRPRKIRRSEANDFGHHLDAVASLMIRTGDESYARQRISDYMKRMHGETSGHQPIGPVGDLGGKRLSSSSDARRESEPEQQDQRSEASGSQNQPEADR